MFVLCLLPISLTYLIQDSRESILKLQRAKWRIFTSQEHTKVKVKYLSSSQTRPCYAYMSLQCRHLFWLSTLIMFLAQVPLQCHHELTYMTKSIISINFFLTFLQRVVMLIMKNISENILMRQLKRFLTTFCKGNLCHCIFCFFRSSFTLHQLFWFLS